MKKNLTKALADLDAAFENLEVKPLTEENLGRTGGGVMSITNTCTDIPGCDTSGVTCNFKCGPTYFWECGSTSYVQCPPSSPVQCPTVVNNCI